MSLPLNIEIDDSEFQAELTRLKSVMNEERFNQVMYSIFRRTGGHVKKVLREDLPPRYYVKASEINAAVGNPKLTPGLMGGVGCAIPIRGTRGSVGGKYSASGGAHGWNNVRYGRKYRVKSRITKDAISTMPAKMPDNYGGYPPFRNLGSKLGGLTFTRKTKNRFPIMVVRSMTIPQMPMHRSREAVQGDIKDYMMKRMEHEFQRVIAGGR